jgi:hypothetical protein
MHSSGENSRKRKNDSAKRGEYRNFDQMSSQMRDTLIESYAEKVIAHAAENGGRCRLGFVKELVGMVSQRAPAIPFHIIRDPSLSTNSDLSVSFPIDARTKDVAHLSTLCRSIAPIA